MDPQSLTLSLRYLAEIEKRIQFSFQLYPSPQVSLLPSATKLRQGNVFTPVCFSVHRWGVCLSACWDIYPLDRQPPPGRHPQADTPPGRPPWADTPLGRHPLGRHPPAVTAADSMHPTGMHSCILLFSFWHLRKELVNLAVDCIRSQISAKYLKLNLRLSGITRQYILL